MGCCVNPETLSAEDIQETQSEVSWTTDFGIASYNLFYREQGETEWILYGNYPDTNATTLEGMTLCTDYELLINPACSEDPTDGTILEFRTKGCGACLDNVYCESFGENSNDEYIEEIAVGDFVYASGNNGGYALFEDLDITLAVGESYPTYLLPGFTGPAYEEFFKLWIDLNQDGEFSEPEELLLSSEEGSSDTLIGQIEIPEDALTGPTRMRISMKYVGGFWIPDNVEACENFQWGETEDYCITLSELTSTEDVSHLDEFNLFPNPAGDFFNIEFAAPDQSELFELRIFDGAGKMLKNVSMATGLHSVAINELSEGLYIYHLVNDEGAIVQSGKVVKTR